MVSSTRSGIACVGFHVYAKQFKPAFTLIELLVVISIITLLIGILLPALAMAHRAARTMQSTANIRSISQGMYVYANDFKFAYPATGHSGLTWMEHLGLPAILNTSDFGTPQEYSDYLAKVNACGKYIEDPRAFISPNDSSEFTKVGNVKRRWTSYGFNGYFSYDHPPYFGAKLDSVKVPSGTITLAEYRDEDANATAPWEDHFVPQFVNDDPTQTFAVGTHFLSGFAAPGRYGLNVVNPNINIAAYPFPASFNMGAMVDFSGDARDAWDSTKMQFNSTFDAKRYGGLWLYGFADGHAGMLDPAVALQWSNTSQAPTVNRFDPENMK